MINFCAVRIGYRFLVASTKTKLEFDGRNRALWWSACACALLPHAQLQLDTIAAYTGNNTVPSVSNNSKQMVKALLLLKCDVKCVYSTRISSQIEAVKTIGGILERTMCGGSARSGGCNQSQTLVISWRTPQLMRMGLMPGFKSRCVIEFDLCKRKCIKFKVSLV